MKITVFLGAPGSGKGTQAKRLALSHGFTHLSTGDMLRAAITEKTALGLKAKGFMDQGALVPDNLMIDLIGETLAKLPNTSTILLDGFPRTVPQAKALDANPRTTVHQAIYFSIPEKALIQRLTGRRTCKKCGEPYHLLYVTPKVAGKCDKCGSDLIQRPDDTEEVARHRLEVFRGQNEGLLAYYRQEKKLNELNADQDVLKIESLLTKFLEA